MKLIKQMRSLIYDSSRKINERVFILLTMVAMVILFVALVGDALYNNSIVEIITIIVLMLVVTGVTAFGIKADKIDIISKIISVVIMIALPIIFIFTGGAEGAAILWFVFYYLYIGLVLTGWWRIVNLIILTAVVIGLFVFEYRHPELVREQVRWIFYLDTSLAVVEVGFVCFIMTWFQNRMFNIENKKAKEETHKVEEMNISQNRFFSSMSHEIRTPINSILGLNEIILKQEDASQEIIRDAENIQGAGKMLLALINDILDFSKMEAGKMDIVPINYSVTSMISEIVNMMWLRAEQKGLEFRIEVDPSIPAELFGDEVRIKQILVNLLNNAVKYTQEGSVTLHIEREDMKDDRILLMFSVIDTGIGIKQDAIPHLFDAFQRVDEEKNLKIEGTGLGLSIVRQLVELMDGKVTVNSVYTQGSTFVVTLWQKISRNDAIGDISIEGFNRKRDDESYEPAFTAPEATILIVDDNEMNLEVEKKLIAGTGMKIDTARNGEEALLKTLAVRYDMILMDHLMPGMDGIECMQHIRKQTGGLNNHVPIVVLTANAGSENRELYVNSGFDGYLVKPVTGNQLEDMILLHVPETKVTRNKNRHDSMMRMNNTGSYDRKIPVLVTASTSCDIPGSIIRNQHIDVIPYNVFIDGGIYYDRLEAGPEELLRYMNIGKSFNVDAPSVEELEAFFGRELKKAHNIIYITVSNPEGTEFKRAREASKAYGNVRVFDSGMTSGGAGLLALAAARMCVQGKSAEKIIEGLEELKAYIRSCFVTNGVYFMNRNGLLDRGIFNIIKMLNIRPFISFSMGKLSVGRLSVGNDNNRCYDKFVDYSLGGNAEPDPDIVVVTYAGLAKEELERIEKRISKRCPFKKIVFVKGSAPFVFNSGQGSFGITYFINGDIKPGLSSMFSGDVNEEEIPEDNSEERPDISEKEADILELKWFEKIPGIDGNHALRNSGSEDTLRNTLGIFYDSIEYKSNEIEVFYDNEDWNSYTIKVHALKSSARLIGADKLADDAQALENAGKRADYDFIRNNNAELIKNYRAFSDILKPVFGDKLKKKADGMLIDITYDCIRDALNTGDITAIKEALDEISAYELPDEDALKIDQIRDCLETEDINSIKALI